ncbi:hypothetical protein PR202_gb01519 [Eleusine coracana subsp. coracana]|uniref:DUF1618 domain-containing protein n=1 Tax=Eleusine coracana subsp. coracana TaxID=191504 RepID=A0AAV5DXM3_ELECO|nr:hypothetical protein PR202_gb01519 [Eleusine coracana subsp. coracana]
MPLRRLLGLSAAAAARYRRGLSTAASRRPPWAIIRKREQLIRSPALRASFQLATPPCVSRLFVPTHFIDPSPFPDRDGDIMPLLGCGVRAASGDGLLLLDSMDGRATAPIVRKHGTLQARQPVDGLRVLGRYRRFGVSEGKLRYAEVSQKKPFILSSFTLDDDGSSWTLEHRVALSPLLPDENQEGENTPCIGVIDPLDASMMCLILGDHAISVDMDKSKVLALSLLDRGGGSVPPFTGFLQPCVLPPWLGATPIPAGGKKERAKGNTLADVLVRSGRD